jgi:hypothetical protein
VEYFHITVVSNWKRGYCDTDSERRGGVCIGNMVWSHGWGANQSFSPNRNHYGKSDALEFDREGLFLWYNFAAINQLGPTVKYY